VKERPILMSGPMVRAILEGRKTQTRRIVKPQPSGSNTQKDPYGWRWKWVPTDKRIPICEWGKDTTGWISMLKHCPYGVHGDRLWVKETFAPHGIGDGGIAYRADGPEWDDECDIKWKPSLFMPRWASRITLEIEAVRVERLIEISNDDAIAEGVVYRDSCWFATDDPKALPWMTASGAYRELWESINGPGSWDANPWVWVIQFPRFTP